MRQNVYRNPYTISNQNDAIPYNTDNYNGII